MQLSLSYCNYYAVWCTPKFLNSRRVRSWGTFPRSQHFGGKRVCWSFGMGLGRMISNQSLTQSCTNQTTSWLVHGCNIFGVRTNHGQIQTNKSHHNPNLGEAITFPLIVYSMANHRTKIQMTFCPGTPKWESRNSQS
jgi:hypothetical protein